MGDGTKHAIYWIAMGGMSFRLPVIVVEAALGDNVDLLTLNVAPFVGLALLGTAS